MLQLFHATHFYVRLMGLVFLKTDLFDNPKSPRGRAHKRGGQAACLVACGLTAKWVGYHQVCRILASSPRLASPRLAAAAPRQLVGPFTPPRILLQVQEELRLISGKREVFTPAHRQILPHDVTALEEILIEANDPTHHPTRRTPHDIAVIEAAEAARRAYAEALTSKYSVVQMNARRAMASRLYLQVRTHALAMVVDGSRFEVQHQYPAYYPPCIFTTPNRRSHTVKY